MSDSEKKDSCIFKKMGRAAPVVIAIVIIFIGLRMLGQAASLSSSEGGVTGILSAAAGLTVLITGVFILAKVFSARGKKP